MFGAIVFRHAEDRRNQRVFRMAAKTRSKSSSIDLVDCKVELEDRLNSSIDTDEEDDILDDMDCTDETVTWELIEEDNNQVLVNSLGYTYAKKVTSKAPKEDGIIDWRCTVRSRTINCAARVMQREERFIAGDTPHCHVPLSGGVTQAKAKLKERKAKIARLDALDDEILSLDKDDDSDFSVSPRKTGRKRVQKTPTSSVRKKRVTVGKDGEAVTIKQEKQDDGDAQRLYSNLEWEIVENGTSRGYPGLVNSMGYMYTEIRRSTAKSHSNNTYWRCAVRNKRMVCNSRVIQCGDTFTCQGPLHCHGPKSDNAANNAKLRASIREEARKAPKSTPQEILEVALSKTPEVTHLPSAKHLLLKGARNWQTRAGGIKPKPKMTPQRFDELAVESADLEWQILPHASARGSDFLVNKLGYTYTQRCKGQSESVEWRCTSRSKTNTCKARVLQKGDRFVQSDHTHSHPPKPNAKAKANLRSTLRSQLDLQTLTTSSLPTAKLVEAALKEAGVTETEIGKRDTIIRTVNKRRKDAKDKVLYSGTPKEHSYTASHVASGSGYGGSNPGPLVKVVQHSAGAHNGSLFDVSGEGGGGDYDDDDDDDDGGEMLLGGNGCELFGELQQGEDGTLYLFQQPAQIKAQEQTNKLKEKVMKLEHELQSYKQKVETLQKKANRPMVIKLDQGTVQTIACSHQDELRTLRSFRDAAESCRVKLSQENKRLKKESEELQTKYQALSQQMALREAELCERNQGEDQPPVSVVIQPQTLTTDENAPAQTFHVPSHLIQGSQQLEQTIEVPGELIQGTEQTIEVPGELIQGTEQTIEVHGEYIQGPQQPGETVEVSGIMIQGSSAATTQGPTYEVYTTTVATPHT